MLRFPYSLLSAGFTVVIVIVGLLMSSCTSVRSANRTPAPPQFLEMRSSPSASTLHFPSGRYTFDATDSSGYYYRAPQQVIKHAFAGAQPFDGGVFVSKSDRRKLRGYLIWAGGRTKIGNFSQTQHSFHD